MAEANPILSELLIIEAFEDLNESKEISGSLLIIIIFEKFNLCFDITKFNKFKLGR